FRRVLFRSLHDDIERFRRDRRREPRLREGFDRRGHRPRRCGLPYRHLPPPHRRVPSGRRPRVLRKLERLTEEMAPEFFSEVADLFTEPALLVRTDGRVLAVNRAAKRLGLVEEDSVGRPLAELTPMPAGEVDRFLRTAARSSNPSPGALVLRSPKGAQAKCRVFGAAISNGSRVSPPEQVLIRIVPPENAADSPFALLGRKIRELDAEIRERRRLEVGLRGERERLEVTLSSIGDGVIITDTTGRVEFLNAIAE